jgi:hypothetical protein
MQDDFRFTVRTYRDGDEAAILDLFARSFHAPRSREHFEWKYRRNPYGNERIALAFDDAGRLVGHYSAFPVPFRSRDGNWIGHQVGDTMTEPTIRHVGRGPTSILGRTALHFYERFSEGKAGFNYGFNVANIQKFSLRFLRSDRVEPVTYRVRAPLPPIGRWERWLRGYQLEVVKETGAELDELFDRVARDYGFLIRRDATYVRWRYLQTPEAPYHVVAIRKWRRLVGWIVFRIRENRFTWGDALFDPHFPDAVEVALRHVVPSHPVDVIEGWFPPRPLWFDSILRDLGFETKPEPQDLSLMCVPFELADATDRMRSSLYYTWGDSDLF